jgi:acyl transferase domain-containing protein
MADANAETGAGQLPALSASGTMSTTDIAVIGMAGIFPGARDLRRYWQNICNRFNAITEVPSQRWRTDDFYSPDRLARDRIYSRWGGFLDPVPFDPVKWRIPPASVPHIEPTQLLALEVAWQAMADAGYDPLRGKPEIRNPKSESAGLVSDFGFRASDFPRERAGVLFAVSGSHELGTAYCFRTMMRHYLPRVEALAPEVREQIYASLEAQLPEWTEDSFPGFLGNIVAGRIAREFDFHGPNFIVDAACASSLAALFTAVQMLRAGTADLMLVGGADGTNNAFGYMSFSRTHALSPRGRSRAFDDSGDGITLGEAVAAVVLKRLADARRDGDRVYALLKGIGTSSDGKNRSLTAPHPPGQRLALDRAYQDARLSPASVTLLEAHGTGTAVGDSAELTTLTQVFGPHTHRRRYVAVGSVKSMIGHTKTVAGLASLIKTILALTHRVLPPTIGIDRPNRQVDLSQSLFYLNTEMRPWVEPVSEEPRRAGVSSFGFGGTNFHVVLEEPTRAEGGEPAPNWTPRAAEVLFWRRVSRAELVRDLTHFREQLDSIVTDDLAALASAVCADESTSPAGDRAARLAIVAGSIEDLRHKIRKALDLLSDRKEINDPGGIYYSEATAVQPAELCLLYPGQGAQSVNMLRDLVIGCLWSHAFLVEANRLLRETLPQPLTDYVFPPPVFRDAEREQQTAALLDTRIAQPALGLVELFATDLLERFGVRPAFVAGHSYGELVALHVAGCLSRADLLRLSAHRGRLCAEAAASHPGAMASVQADGTVTETALRELDLPARIANQNAPDQTVIAGPAPVIDAAIEQLRRRGLRARKLPVSAAFHTPELAAASAAMTEYLAGISLHSPRLPVYSNTTGRRHSNDPDTIRDLLARHLCEPVRFEQELRQLYTDGARLFLEVGPGRILSDLVSRTVPTPAIVALSLDGPGRDGWTRLGHTLGRLAVLGLPVRLVAWFEGRGLTDGSLTEFVRRVRAESTLPASAWLISPDRAEPLTPLTPRRPNDDAPSASARDELAERSKASAAPGPDLIADPADLIPPIPEHPIQREKQRMIPTGDDLFTHFQETTRLLVEAQQAQNRVLERYLEIQERLLQQANGGVARASASASPRSVGVSTAVEGSAPSAPRVRPAPAVARPPVPIPPSAPITPSDFVASTAGHAINRPATAGDRSSMGLTVPAVNGQVPPPTDKFRQDLLEVVSARTGYPIDALDETLALEAELGIDSIKTVEIFSQLKAYHAFFRAEDQAEEEQLVEFTRLKTLRDIIASYDRRRQMYLAGQQDNGVAAAVWDTANGHAPVDGPLKRYEVVPTAAPLPSNNEKKNGAVMDTPSS